jgi:molecular chaperone GrpE
MTDPNPTDDEALLDRFRDWLRDARAEADGLNGDQVDPPSGPEVGLYRLAEEFTALRHEVKLETKGSRGLQEQIDTLLPALRQAIDQFRSVAPKEEQAVSAVGKPMAEAMADLDEALARGRLEIEKARDRLEAEAAELATSIESNLDSLFKGFSWFRRRSLRAYHEQVRTLVDQQVGKPRPGLFDALLEGYGLIQDRLRKAMDAGQVRRIDTFGRAVDPALMTVLEVVDLPGRISGQVVDEARRGYTWRGRVLRYAEVRAVRQRAVEDVEAVEAVEDVEEQGEFEDAEEPELGAD